MHKLLKWLGIVLAVLIVLVGAVVTIGPSMVDWKDRIAAAAKDATGRDLTISGDVSVSLFPTISVDASDVRFADAPEAPQPHMATVESLSVRVALWPLLGGRVVVEQLLVQKPQVALRVDQEGRPNWAFDTSAEDAGDTDDQDTGDGAAGAGDLPRVTLKDVRIEQGAITFTNAVTGQEVDVQQLRLSLGLPALDQPFGADLEMQLNGKPVTLTAELATPDTLMRGEQGTLSIDLDSEDATLTYAGGVQRAPVPGLDGTLSLNVPSVGKLAAWLDRPIPGQDPGKLGLDAEFATDGAVTRLERFDLEGEAVRASATGRVDLSGDVTEVVLDLESDTLNIDRYLPPPSTQASQAQPAPNKVAKREGGPDGNPLAALPEEPFDLAPLRNLKADIKLSVAGMRVRGFEVGQLNLRTTAEQGVAKVELAQLKLYGGEAFGTVELNAAGDTPAIEGDLGLSGLNVGALLRAATQGPPPVAGIAGGAVAFEAAGVSPRAMAQSLRGQIDADLKEVDAQSAAAARVSGLDLSVAFPGVDAKPSVDARVVYNGVPVQLTATSDPLPEVLSGERFQLAWSIESQHLNASYQGAMQRRPAPGPDGQLTAATPSVGKLLAWLGQPLPGAQPDPGKLELTARIATQDRMTRIETVQIRGQDLRVDASGEVDRGADPMRVRLTLETGELDLNRYLPAPAADSKAAAPAETAGDKSKAGGNPLAQLPDEPIDLKALRNLDAQVELTMAGLGLRELTLGRTAMTATVKDGTATLDLAELRAFGGNLRGKGVADASGSELDVRVDLTADNLDLAQVPQAKPLGGGSLSAQLSGQSRGASPRALANGAGAEASVMLSGLAMKAGPGTLSAANAEISVPAMDQTVAVTAKATYNDKPVSADITVGSLNTVLAQQPFALKASLAAPSTTATFDGQVTPAAPAAAGKLDLDVKAVRQVLAWLNIPLPKDQPDPGGLTLVAQLDGGAERMELTSAEITGNAMQATASGLFDATAKPKRFALDLDVQRANLNAYLPPRERQPDKAGDGKTSEVPAKADEGWSEEPIDVSPLRQAQGTMKVALKDVQYRELTVERGRLDAELMGGVLTSELSDVQLAEGTVAANAKVDTSNDVPAVNYALSVDGVQARPVLTALAGSDRLSGTTQFTTKGSTRGPHQAALVGNLNGDGAFTFRDGAIHGINLAASLRQARSLGLEQQADEDRKTDFAELSGSFDIKNGILSNQDLKMLAPLLRLTGAGQVMLPPKQIDYRLEAKLVGTLKGQGGQQALKGVPIPIRIQGPFSKPSYGVDWESAVTSAAQDPERLKQMPEELKKNLDEQLQGEGGLGGVLKGLGGTSGRSTESTPEDQVKQVIQGLTGGGSGGDTKSGTSSTDGGAAEPQPQPQTQQKPKSDAEKAVDTIKGLFGN